MPSILFIINPISGTKRKDVVETAIQKYIDPQKFSIHLCHTEYAGHASLLAAEAANSGTDIVVAVGGDGTVNEVARALIHTQTALGIIPCGSGNGLARHLGIPTTPIAAVKVINRACIARLDYGRINDTPFFCTCGVGFDAFISQKFAEAGKRGLATYAEKTLTDGLNYKPETYTLIIDGDEGKSEEHEAFLIACANASQYGNNAFIAPHASMNDGLMDITILKPFNLIEAPIILTQLFSKTLPLSNHVHTFRTRHLRIMRQQAGPAHIDGDPITLPAQLDIELVPNSLLAVINEKARLPEQQSSEENSIFQRFTEPLFQLNFEKTRKNIQQKTNEELQRLNKKITHLFRKN